MIRAVIFDLDGVLVATDELHYRSWQRVTTEEHIPFDRQINERLRGISRPESLEIVLQRAPRHYTSAEKGALAERKQSIFCELAARLTTGDLLPGVLETLTELRRRGLKTAVGSSSRNTALIIDRLGVRELFDTIVDGNDVQRAKPDPDVFLEVARRLGVPPSDCLVIEDAGDGIESARRAGMPVFGIGTPETLPNVPRVAPSLAHVDADRLLSIEC